jgi:hypothetical protein
MMSAALVVSLDRPMSSEPSSEQKAATLGAF